MAHCSSSSPLTHSPAIPELSHQTSSLTLSWPPEPSHQSPAISHRTVLVNYCEPSHQSPPNPAISHRTVLPNLVINRDNHPNPVIAQSLHRSPLPSHRTITATWHHSFLPLPGNVLLNQNPLRLNPNPSLNPYPKLKKLLPKPSIMLVTSL